MGPAKARRRPPKRDALPLLALGAWSACDSSGPTTSGTRSHRSWLRRGKNPLYVARQMGHYSAGFTLDTYGHLMESVPKRQVEWIDELVFPEGWEAALNLHLSGAPSSATPCRSCSIVGGAGTLTGFRF